MRYELTDRAWAAIKPFLPSKLRSVPRVNDRRILNGIFSFCDPGHRGACSHFDLNYSKGLLLISTNC